MLWYGFGSMIASGIECPFLLAFFEEISFQNVSQTRHFDAVELQEFYFIWMWIRAVICKSSVSCLSLLIVSFDAQFLNLIK